MITDAKPLNYSKTVSVYGIMVAWSIAATLGVWFLFFQNLGDRDLWSSHEARSGLNARTILETGIWWLPGRTNEFPDVQKPPMYYWLVALFSGDESGVNSWTIRLPSVLGALSCILAVVFIGRTLGDIKTGLWAALVLATAVHFVWSARIGRIDMPLTAATTLYGLFVIRYVLHNCTRDLVWASLLVAIAILFKGPIGLVFCGVTAFAIWFSLARNTQTLFGLSFTGFLGGALTLPWFLYAHLVTEGDFSKHFFIEHNWDRGLGTGRLRSHPFWFYPVQFLWDFQPWPTIGLILGFFNFKQVKQNFYRVFEFQSIKFFSIIWLLLLFSALSISNFKRADYLLVAYPACSLLLGSFLNSISIYSTSKIHKTLFLFSIFFGVSTTFLVLSWLIFVDIPNQEPYRDAKLWAKKINLVIPIKEPILFFGEEAHSLAFHLNRQHRILGKPEELADCLSFEKPVWVITNPEVLSLWPGGPPGTKWEKVDSNTQTGDGQAQHKPLILLKAFLP